MSQKQILVVEDENIIAMEIKDRLEKLGYNVPAVVSSGMEAVEKARDLQPDLVLMDIMLEGKMDGVEAAGRIRDLFDIPVVYLTAYSDDKTLERAKVTEPYGYVLKPLEQRELHTSIEIALYKHKMERKLKESEQWFSTTLKSIGDAVITTDIKGQVTFMNSVAESLTGWKQEEALGKSSKEIFNLTDEETRSLSNNPVTKVLQMGSPLSLTNNSILISRDGKQIPIDDSAAPIKDDKGNIKGIVLVFRDITKQKKLEKQLRQAQKMEAIATLTGGIAHDFNNIMTAIQVGIDLTLIDVDISNPLYGNLEEIHHASSHASKLARQLLLFSRRHPMKPILINLNSMIEGLLRMLHRLIGKDIGIKTTLESELWKVQADEGTMEQVIMNLSLNARDAMPNGGELTIKTKNVVFDEIDCKGISEAKPGRFVCLSVVDNGTGMDKETTQRIFEPFFTTKGPAKGTGLGLSVVYGIVKQHNGWINVYSEPDHGTTFNIYLPAISKDVSTKASEKVPLKTLRGNGERILIVDDEKRICEFAEKALRKNGYETFIAANSEQALTLFKKERGNFQLIFSDVVLPDKSGVELAEKLLSFKPDLHVLLSSGYPDHKSQWSTIRGKGFQFLQKPYTLNDLLRTISMAINQ